MILENPIDFSAHKEAKGISLEYIDLMEIAQGGPQVGKLRINGSLVSPNYFGGPPIIDEGRVFVPMFIRKFCLSGFRICKIDINTNQVQYIGKVKNLIYLGEVKGDVLSYYIDLKKQNMEAVRI